MIQRITIRKTLMSGIAVVAFFLVGFCFQAQAAQAASLKFDQTAYSATTGNTFKVQVVVDAGTDSVVGSDAYVLYDSSKLQPTAIDNGTYFPNVTNNMQYATGKLYVSGSVSDQASAKTGSGTMATVTFKVLADGTSTLSYDCNGSTIVQSSFNATNVMTCSENGSASVTAGASGTSSSTTNTSNSSTPATNTNSSTSASTQLPRTGFFDDVRLWGTAGILLVIIGGGLRLAMLL